MKYMASKETIFNFCLFGPRDHPDHPLTDSYMYLTLHCHAVQLPKI